MAKEKQEHYEPKKPNINTASFDELRTKLFQIGPRMIQSIIDYRDMKGPFRSARDLRRIANLGARRISYLENAVEFGPPEGGWPEGAGPDDSEPDNPVQGANINQPAR